MKTTHLLTILLMLALVAACTATPTGNATGQHTAETITIGFIAPMTGPAAPYGTYSSKAFQMGIDDWNAQSEDFNFVPLYEDGKCNGGDAARAANKLVHANNVHYLMGFCSGESIAIAPIAEANKVILFSAGSGTPDLTHAGDYVFRSLVSDDFTARALARTAIERGDRKMVLITENTNMPQTTKRAFVGYYTAQGGEIIFDDVQDIDNGDFRTSILKGMQQDASVFIMAQSYSFLQPLFKQMEEAGWHPVIYTNDVVGSTEGLKQLGDFDDIVEGAIFTEQKFDPENPQTATVLAKYKARYGTIDGPVAPNYIATHYDAAFMLGEAIRSVGDDPTAVKDYLYTIKNREYSIGTFSFDENGDAVTDVVVKQIQDGEAVVIG